MLCRTCSITPSSKTLPAPCSCSQQAGKCWERLGKLVFQAGIAVLLTDRGTRRELWLSALGQGQSPLHRGYQVKGTLLSGCRMGTWLCLSYLQIQTIRGCGNEFILEAGMQGVPNLSGLPKASQGVCGTGCDLLFFLPLSLPKIAPGRRDCIYPPRCCSEG